MLIIYRNPLSKTYEPSKAASWMIFTVLHLSGFQATDESYALLSDHRRSGSLQKD